MSIAEVSTRRCTDILLKSHFEGKCTPVFSITLEICMSKEKYHSWNFDFCTFNIYTIIYLAALRSEFVIILTFKTFFLLKKSSFHIFKCHDDFYFGQYFEKEDLLRFVDISFHCHSRKVSSKRLLLSYSEVRESNNECITLCPIAQ